MFVPLCFSACHILCAIPLKQIAPTHGLQWYRVYADFLYAENNEYSSELNKLLDRPLI